MQRQCPNCKSFKVSTDRAITAAVGIGMIIIGGLFSFLIFPVFIALAGIVVVLAAALNKPKRLMCRQCGAKTTL